MRSVVKYISLLLFSGLIIAFYCVTFTQSPPPAVKPNPFVTAPTQPGSSQPIGQAIIINIAKNLFPALKSLISL
jgi:hypothetical protein